MGGCSKLLQPLFLEFIHKNQVATTKEDGRVIQKYDIMWDGSKVSPLRQRRITQIKISEGVRKGKGYIGIHETAHAPDEKNHRENIFHYQGRIIGNADKCKTK